MGSLNFLLWNTDFCSYTFSNTVVCLILNKRNFTVIQSRKNCYILSYFIGMSVLTYVEMLAKSSAELSMSMLPSSSFHWKGSTVDIMILTMWVYVIFQQYRYIESKYGIREWGAECFESKKREKLLKMFHVRFYRCTFLISYSFESIGPLVNLQFFRQFFHPYSTKDMLSR